MTRRLTFSTLLLTALLSACTTGGTGGPPSIKSIELTPASASVGVGGTVTLSATARDGQGKVVPNVAFLWKSSSETVAKVAGGVVTGLSAGMAGITASADGVTGPAANVTVTGTQPQPNGNFDLNLSGDKLPIVTGTAASLTVNVTRKNGFTGAVTLSLGGLPDGASAAPITLAPDQASATVTVGAAANAPHSQPTAVTLSAAATGAATVMKALTVTVRGPAGSLDTTFGAGGIAVTPVGAGEDVPYAVAAQPDGGLTVVGSSASNVSDDFTVVRYTRDGALDATFGSGGKVSIDFAGKADIARAVAHQSDGKIVVVGGVTNAGNEERFGVARLNANGTLDSSFGQGGKVVTAFAGSGADRASAVLVQPDGSIVVGGHASLSSSASGMDFALARYTAVGVLDASFGNGGQVITAMTPGGAADAVHALALQGGKIIAAGGEGDFKAARYTASGTLDASFGTGGKVSSVFGGSVATVSGIALDAQNRLVLAGQSQNDTAAVRLSENGALDTTFGDGGKKIIAVNPDNWDAAQGVSVQADGKVVLGGWVYGVGSQSNFAVTRLNAGGQLDTGFGQGGTTVTPVAPGVKPDEVRALALQTDDRIPATRIVAVGVRNDSNQDFALTRYWP
ncbi:Ig-like domain-containing protein [Deinococcus hopiensis]|nr:Ig-like domain-containing protein [Deinococcus hopiensis]